MLTSLSQWPFRRKFKIIWNYLLKFLFGYYFSSSHNNQSNVVYNDIDHKSDFKVNLKYDQKLGLNNGQLLFKKYSFCLHRLISCKFSLKQTQSKTEQIFHFFFFFDWFIYCSEGLRWPSGPKNSSNDSIIAGM